MSRFAGCALPLCRASAASGSRSLQFTGAAHARVPGSSTRTGATIPCSHSASSSNARQDEDIAYRSKGVLQKEVWETLLTMTFVKGIADCSCAPRPFPLPCLPRNPLSGNSGLTHTHIWQGCGCCPAPPYRSGSGYRRAGAAGRKQRTEASAGGEQADCAGASQLGDWKSV